MSQDDDGAEAELPALFKTGAHERGSDACALTRRENSHRGETHDPQRGIAGERNGRKHDVPDDGALVLGDERDQRVRLFAERVDQTGFHGGLERGCVHGVYSGAISWSFSSNQHAMGLRYSPAKCSGGSVQTVIGA